MNKQTSPTFKDYLSLVKFSHTIFALPFALIGYFLALHLTNNTFTLRVFLLVLLCMIFARNAAMSFNRVTDRFIDQRNPRTSSREIPSGKIQPRHAFIFSMVNAILFIVTTLFINKLVFCLSPIALLVVLGYSYTKKYTVLCHFVLGLGLSLAPIGAFLATTGQWHPVPILLSMLVFTWVAGFDILYSTLDEDFDKEESLKSIPAIFGSKLAKIISASLHLIVICLVIKIGIDLNTGNLYTIGAVIFIALLIAQHLVVMISNSQRGVNFAFAYLNGIASLLFALFSICSFYF
ncbi:MAG: putative 4-hydroxybenzoate polyprenyltransferase [Bacteroidales bacterium]|nr:putative 4-hydroxybenzoate polyprenyltransferase [Bacteroidales bacterium]MDD4673128.1 putative 4-hydroxybenzoate polyprenyltransferase [Bacteroidales bacterium]